MNESERICRTCMNPLLNSKEFFDILKWNQEFCFIPKNIINKFIKSDYQILDNDEFPKEICKTCLDKFFSFNEFIENCISVQMLFKNILYDENESCVLPKSEFNDSDDDYLEYEAIEFDKNSVVSENIETNTDNLFIEEIDYSISEASTDLKSKFKLDFVQLKDESESLASINNEILDEIKIEIEDATKMTSFNCSYCPADAEGFVDMTTLLNHFSSTHEQTLSMEKEKHSRQNMEITVCDICGLEMRQYKLKNHTEVVHQGKLPFKCEYCDDAFAYKINLTSHIKLAHKEQYLSNEKNKNKQVFECEHCKQIFKNVLALEGHCLKMHNPNHPRNSNPRNKPYPCSECDRIYYRQDHLSTHIKKIHRKIMPFKCDICKKKFCEQFELNQHLRKNHQDFESLECDVCGKMFRGGYANYAYMKRHKIEQHSDLPQFNCLLCEAKFFKKTELNKHGKEHANETNNDEEYYTFVEYLSS